MTVLYRIIDFLFPFACFKMDFMKNALLALLLLTPLLSLFGTMAVNKNMAFFSDALGHSALAGAGLGVLLGIPNELIGMLVFGILFSLLIIRVNKSASASSDTTISVFSSTGIALGLFLLSRNGSFSRYSTLLTGDVLSVRPNDLLWLFLALLAGVGLWVFTYNRMLLTVISAPLSQSRGIHTQQAEILFVIPVAVAVMLSIQWVGVLLINALLILPAAAARNISRNSAQHALFSVLTGLVCGIVGLVLAYNMNTGVGAAVVLCAAICYFLSLLLKKALKI